MSGISENLDWLAREVIGTFEEGTATADPAYLAAKIVEFEGLDRLAIMRSLSSLDARNRAAFARRIGVSTGDLDAFLRVLRCL